MEQRDSDRFGAACSNVVSQFSEAVTLERGEFVSLGAEASGYTDPVVAIDEWRKPVPDECVQLRSILPSDLDDVFEALVRHQDDSRASAFEQGVRRDGRAVQQGELLGLPEDLTDAIEHGL